MLIDILIALAVVGGVGLLAAILLAVFSHFFAVAQDEREKNIREALPGANCGACGCKGCDDYAASVAAGTVAPNLCIPGGAGVTAAISAIMGAEASAAKSKVAFVHCNGTCEATSKKMIYDGVQSCRAATAVYGGPNSCNHGCMGFGDCSAVCPADAICIEDGIARVDTRLCVGCGVCVRTCPKSIISLVPKETKTAVICNSKDKGADARKLCKNSCIGCKKCEKACPENAISVVNNLAKIDYDKCTGCGVCTSGCPTGCLKSVILSVAK